MPPLRRIPGSIGGRISSLGGRVEGNRFRFSSIRRGG